MPRPLLFPVLSLALSLACSHAPRVVARALTEPVTAPVVVAAADRDGDGFPDAVDRCADDPGIEPDGCPVPDSEGDGICDADDQCPTHPETRNGYQDEDGCPDEVPSQLARFTGTIKGINFGGGGKGGRPVAAAPLPIATTVAGNAETYAHVAATGFVAAADDPLATFSADVDTASYSNMRRFLAAGQLPPSDAVRTEELINYFDYDYPRPIGGEVFAVYSEVGPCPWNPKHRLVHLGIQAREIKADRVPARNLVFLIDVSGSMADADKLPLLKQGLGRLIDDLRPQDRVAMVVYAGAAGVVLAPTAGDERGKIRAALDRLEAGGSTAGGQGIALAYALAERRLIKGAINRVVLATDGDFNVGTRDQGSLVAMIGEKRKHGIGLTVLGFGQGNLNDALMEGIADQGDGNYAYIDSLEEAHKVLVREASATLVTVARDVKLQVEWNPARVASYRQIGYDNRQLADRDFRDDAKDAGEVGAGHAVTALFEVVPAGEGPAALPLRYQQARPGVDRGDELLTLSLRSKTPEGKARPEQAVHVRDAGAGELGKTSADFRFSAAVAELGLLLRGTADAGEASHARVLKLARGSQGRDRDGDRREFVMLVEALQANLAAAQAGRAAEEAWLKQEAAAAGAPATRAVGAARRLPASALPIVARTAAVMREFTTIRVEISGHSDDREGRSHGELMAIARARAEAVQRALVEREHIDPARLEVRAAGPNEPVDTNRTAAGRANNRRIEFTILVQ